ncbi:hypothetical protein [Nonomuraea sp. NPDC050786]|uniref:hypothetical protein n=1 Tax=Nonomuraea sp. NPDC050786 TaxID=3154840 RepID=UPI0033CA2F9A
MASMTVHPPPIPEEVRILTGTSNSDEITPEDHGIDSATEWWCEAIRRPRYGDAVAWVRGPGGRRYDSFLMVTLPANDLDDAERTGRYAIEVARHLARVIADPDDRQAWDTLQELLSPDGPMGGSSKRAWHRIHQWLPNARRATSMLDMPSVDI